MGLETWRTLSFSGLLPTSAHRLKLPAIKPRGQQSPESGPNIAYESAHVGEERCKSEGLSWGALALALTLALALSLPS